MAATPISLDQIARLWTQIKAYLGTNYMQKFPVGAIYLSVDPTNPSTYFGGTWVAWGTGRMPIGVDAGNTSFDTPEETGGNVSHTHASAAHTHTMGSHTHTDPNHYHDLTPGWAGLNQTTGVCIMGGRATSGWAATERTSGTYAKLTTTQYWGANLYGTTNWMAQGTQQTGGPSTNTTDSTTPGSTGGPSQLPPYITCYMWKRTA